MTDDRSVNWLRCQLMVACPALNSFSSYVVNNFEELNDMNTKTLKNGSFKLLCFFRTEKHVSGKCFFVYFSFVFHPYY